MHSPLGNFVLVAGQLLQLAFSVVPVAIWLTAFLPPAKAATARIDSANKVVPELFLPGAILPLIRASAPGSTFRRGSPLAGIHVYDGEPRFAPDSF